MTRRNSSTRLRFRRAARAALLTVAVIAAPAIAAHPRDDTVDIAVHVGTGLGEPEIAIDAHHPDDVVIGENNSGVSVSHDRGRHFTHISIPNQGDNTATIDAAGRYYYTSLDGDVEASHDRGLHWSSMGNWVGALAAAWSGRAPSELKGMPFRPIGCNSFSPYGPVDPLHGPGPQVIPCDRPWLTADAGIPGLLHLTFSEHSESTGGSPVGEVVCRTGNAAGSVGRCGREYVSTSRDGGRTWGPFHPIDSPDAPQTLTNGFGPPVLSRGGVLATAYISQVSPGGALHAVFSRSHDEGRTWTRVITPITLGAGDLGRSQAVVVSAGTDVGFEPYLAQDPTRRSRYALAVFDDSQTHLLVYVTTDGGRRWSGPARLAESGQNTRHLPWLAYGSSGALGIMWKTAYPDGSFDVWADVSPRGGTRFLRPVRLSSSRSPGPVSEAGRDDASSLALDASTLHATWGDRREGSLGIHYGRYRFT